MSETIIKNGTGNSDAAKVDSDNRLHTRSVTENALTRLSLDGRAYTVSSGWVTLTTDTYSAIYYIKNTGTDGLILRSANIYIQDAAGATADLVEIKIKASIASHDLTAGIIPLPTRSSKAVTLSATTLAGAEGKACTSALPISLVDLVVPLKSTFEVAVGESYFFLEPGESICVEAKPPAGNTSLKLNASATIYINDGSL